MLAGGRSSEHEVSLRSAASVAAALDPARFAVSTIQLERDGRWTLPGATRAALEPGARTPLVASQSAGAIAPPLDVDVIFPVLHGPFGEDGTVQGLCELLDLPFVGSGVLGSALAMDKAMCKIVAEAAGIPTARAIVLLMHRHAADDPVVHDQVASTLGFPCFVKPARLGSSVGISRVRDRNELAPALGHAYAYDDKVLVEEAVAGREIECGILGDLDPIASVVGEIRPHAEWYDYEAKYTDGGSDIIIPAEVDPLVVARIQEAARRVFVALDLSGLARVDFFLRPDGSFVLNEVNTIPGFTRTSVYASLFGASGVSYSDLVGRLVDLAIARHERRAKLRH